ncbi:MAG TPA: ABC transporter ATP-binding protein [Bacilli bacterium]|jgi:branched-chain amino acid transport system ATP-binding protein|nr:ABC transporter ATP-binding protein [Bacilli bacterium]
MDALLKLEQLVVKYGPITAVKGVDMTVAKGNIVAILGANGAGKSTIIKTIGGINKIASGTITFDGVSFKGMTPNKIAASGIITSPEGRLLFKDLTVEENLYVGAYTLKSSKQTITDASGNTKEVRQSRHQRLNANLERVYGYFPILKERKKQRASTLSGGEQQMLAIGRALMGSPKLLLLDEPSLGLAPLIVKDIFAIIKAVATEGTTILIVEQNAFQTLKIADYAYIMELGKVKAEGKPATLLQDDSLISAYLGGQIKEEKI